MGFELPNFNNPWKKGQAAALGCLSHSLWSLM
jgi:hypothetical protein